MTKTMTVQIGRRYESRLNGRAGTIVIDAHANGGFSRKDFLDLAGMVPPPGGRGSELKGTIANGTCTYKGCTLAYVGEDGFEIFYESMIYDFVPPKEKASE